MLCSSPDVAGVLLGSARGAISRPPGARGRYIGARNGLTAARWRDPSITLTLLGNPPAAEASDPDRDGPAPGLLLGGGFRLVRELASGGMGRIYEAYDLNLDRQVAIKVIKLAGQDAPGREDLMSRFEREAKATARLNHQNIVTVHQYGSWNGIPYLVLELLQGHSLATRLRAGPLPVRESVSIVRQIASALSHAHARGIIHQDLKPLNVFLQSDGRVKLLDFGLAFLGGEADPSRRAAHAGNPPGCGTPAYMAPEQWSGGPARKSTDLWAVGVTFYEMLTRTLPFRASAGFSRSREHVPSLRRFVPSVPRQVEEVVDRLLQKNVARRFRSAEALEDALPAVGMAA